MRRTIIPLLLSALTIFGDTVTTRGHVSVNGKLLEMKNGVIRLEVRSPKGTETRYINAGDVETIEFNATVDNPGGAPKVFGIKPPSVPVTSSEAEPKQPADTVVLRGNDRRECRLVSIDASIIVCEGKANQYRRNVALRVLLAPR